MAKATLPTNFKDDVLASAMGGKRRYNMIHNSDGTVSFEDVTNYTQVGSTFGAAQINATNEAVNNAADASKIIDSLETIKANTQSGYIAGALAVKALNSNLGKELIFEKVFSCNFRKSSATITCTIPNNCTYLIIVYKSGYPCSTFSLINVRTKTIIFCQTTDGGADTGKLWNATINTEIVSGHNITFNLNIVSIVPKDNSALTPFYSYGYAMQIFAC